MEFWKNILDPRENRKIKGFVLATILLIYGIIDAQVWGFSFLIFVGGNEYNKYLKTIEKIDK